MYPGHSFREVFEGFSPRFPNIPPHRGGSDRKFNSSHAILEVGVEDFTCHNCRFNEDDRTVGQFVGWNSFRCQHSEEGCIRNYTPTKDIPRKIYTHTAADPAEWPMAITRWPFTCVDLMNAVRARVHTAAANFFEYSLLTCEGIEIKRLTHTI